MVCDYSTEFGLNILKKVLILLFLECGLRQNDNESNYKNAFSLNPTFSGMWSATNQVITIEQAFAVLILLFLECGLRPPNNSQSNWAKQVLILLFLECGLRHSFRITVREVEGTVLILLFLECGLRPK